MREESAQNLPLNSIDCFGNGGLNEKVNLEAIQTEEVEPRR